MNQDIQEYLCLSFSDWILADKYNLNILIKTHANLYLSNATTKMGLFSAFQSVKAGYLSATFLNWSACCSIRSAVSKESRTGWLELLIQ